MRVFSSVFSPYHTVPASSEHSLRTGAGVGLVALLRRRLAAIADGPRRDRLAIGHVSCQRPGLVAWRGARTVDLSNADHDRWRSSDHDHLYPFDRHVIPVGILGSQLYCG